MVNVDVCFMMTIETKSQQRVHAIGAHVRKVHRCAGVFIDLRWQPVLPFPLNQFANLSSHAIQAI